MRYVARQSQLLQYACVEMIFPCLFIRFQRDAHAKTRSLYLFMRTQTRRLPAGEFPPPSLPLSPLPQPLLPSPPAHGSRSRSLENRTRSNYSVSIPVSARVYTEVFAKRKYISRVCADTRPSRCNARLYTYTAIIRKKVLPTCRRIRSLKTYVITVITLNRAWYYMASFGKYKYPHAHTHTYVHVD